MSSVWILVVSERMTETHHRLFIVPLRAADATRAQPDQTMNGFAISAERRMHTRSHADK